MGWCSPPIPLLDSTLNSLTGKFVSKEQSCPVSCPVTLSWLDKYFNLKIIRSPFTPAGQSLSVHLSSVTRWILWQSREIALWRVMGCPTSLSLISSPPLSSPRSLTPAGSLSCLTMPATAPQHQCRYQKISSFTVTSFWDPGTRYTWDLIYHLPFKLTLVAVREGLQE